MEKKRTAADRRAATEMTGFERRLRMLEMSMKKLAQEHGDLISATIDRVARLEIDAAATVKIKETLATMEQAFAQAMTTVTQGFRTIAETLDELQKVEQRIDDAVRRHEAEHHAGR